MDRDLRDLQKGLFYTIDKIEQHRHDFGLKYPIIDQQLKEGTLTEEKSVKKLLVNELFFLKFLRK